MLQACFLSGSFISSTQPVTESAATFPYCSCFYSRSCFDLAVKGELDVLDGICLTYYGCDVQRYAYSYWKRFTRFPFLYFLNRPHNAKAEGALDFFLIELKDFKQNLEQFSGQEITPFSWKRG